MLCSCNSNAAYILNLRGDDIPFNPVFVSYMYIGLDRAILFVEQEKIEPPVREYLQNLKVEIRDYNGIWSFLRTREWGEGKVRTFAFSSLSFYTDRFVIGDHFPANIICYLAYVNALPIFFGSSDH